MEGCLCPDFTNEEVIKLLHHSGEKFQYQNRVISVEGELHVVAEVPRILPDGIHFVLHIRHCPEAESVISVIEEPFELRVRGLQLD